MLTKANNNASIGTGLSSTLLSSQRTTTHHQTTPSTGTRIRGFSSRPSVVRARHFYYVTCPLPPCQPGARPVCRVLCQVVPLCRAQRRTSAARLIMGFTGRPSRSSRHTLARFPAGLSTLPRRVTPRQIGLVSGSLRVAHSRRARRRKLRARRSDRQIRRARAASQSPANGCLASSTPANVRLPRRSTRKRPCSSASGADHGVHVGHPLVVDVRAALGDRPPGLVEAADQPGVAQQRRDRAAARRVPSTRPASASAARSVAGDSVVQRAPAEERLAGRDRLRGLLAPCTSVVSSSASARCARRAPRAARPSPSPAPRSRRATGS